MASLVNNNIQSTKLTSIYLKSLSIIAINVNSIITNQRRSNLLNLMNQYKPDILLLSETKINKNHKIQFKDYNIVRNDRPNSKQGGGTAVLIKKPLKFKHISLNSQSTNENFENTIIQMQINKKENLFIVSAYATYGKNNEFNREFNNLFQALNLDKPENYYIKAGDFNAKHIDWKNNCNNTKGTLLKRWMENNDLYYKTKLYSTELPSFPSGESYLDLCLADARIKIIGKPAINTVQSINYDSDHNALLIPICLNESQNLEIDIEESSHKFNFKKTNWKKFQSNLTENCNLDIYNNVNICNEEIDNFLKKIEISIKNAMDESVPTIEDRNSCELYSNDQIKKLQKDKSYLITQINKINRNYTPDLYNDLGNLKNLLNQVKIKLKREFNNSVNEYWKTKISSIPINDPANMFPQVNQIFRPKNPVSIPTLRIPNNEINLLEEVGIDTSITPKDKDNNFLIDNEVEKLNIIGAHFANIHKQNNNLGRDELSRIILAETDKLKNEMDSDLTEGRSISRFSEENHADNPKQPDNKLPYFTNFTTAKKIFSTLNNRKSSGLDGIPNIMLKNLPEKIVWYYTVLFNNCLNNTYFPSEWKKAKVIALTKKDKDGSTPSNLRPISLLPNISKVFEVFINRPLVRFCTENNIIPENQFGFRYKHSTIHAINKLTSDICWALNSNQKVGACLIDLEKAFDTVWIPGLIFKMIKKKFPKHLIKIVWNMISNKSFVTSNGNILSIIVFLVENGLQQGTVNSPTLFNIFNSDILNLFGLNSSTEKKSIAFADDLIIYTMGLKVKEIEESLQELFEKIQHYYHTWKLKINTNKCETILFRQNLSNMSNAERTKCKNFAITGQKDIGEKITHKNCVKYLGVHLDDKLNFKKHIETQLTKAKNAFFKTKRLFYAKNLDKKIKILCYQTLIRPLITYGCPIWYNISASLMEKIRVFERKCIRTSLCTYRSESSEYKKYVRNKKLYDLANVHRIDCHILKLVRNHYANTANITENSLISSTCYPNPMYYEKTLFTGHIPPEAFLYLDRNGFIQDRNNIPIIYHVKRHMNVKKILYDRNLDGSSANPLWRYNKAISARDHIDKHRANLRKYWWLNE